MEMLSAGIWKAISAVDPIGLTDVIESAWDTRFEPMPVNEDASP